MKGFGGEGGFPASERVLGEIAGSGYEGTELGDWGFMPTDARVLSPELDRRGLALVGALVPQSLARRSAHEEAVAAALRTARLLAACAAERADGGGPFVVLADDNGADDLRTRFAGRIRPEKGMSSEQWRDLAAGANLVAGAVRDETGLCTVFHHHCAGFIETPEETERLLDETDPELIGLCFDTGHYAYAGGDPLDGLKRLSDRIRQVHFKDCYGEIAERARREGWDYFTAVRNGVFYGLGGGDIDFVSILEGLQHGSYGGWIVVEDELPPGAGDPLERARRDREFLRKLGI